MSAQVKETPDAAASSSVAAVELETVGTALVEFDKVAAGIAKLKQKYEGVVFPVQTAQGMKDAKAARAAVREPRLELERIRQSAKRPLLDIGRKLDAAAKRISAEVEAIEDPIAAQIDNENARIETERLEQLRIENERKAVHLRDIEAIRQLALSVVGKPAAQMEAVLETARAIETDSFEEFSGTAGEAKAKTIQQLEMMLDAQRLLEADRERIRAEQAELAEQRRQQEARDKASQEGLAKLRKDEEDRAAAARAQAEKDAAAAQAKREAEIAEQHRKLRAEREEHERQTRERQAEFDRKEAAAKALRDAEIAAAREADEQSAAASRAVQEAEAGRLAAERAAFEQQQEAARIAALPPAAEETPVPDPHFSEVPAFTKGPWRLTDLRDVYAEAATAEHPRAVQVIVKQVRGRDEENLEANAFLIAAAPDLFEALEMVRDADEDCKRDGLQTIPAMARAKIDRALWKAINGAEAA